jgi:Tfp pilus assembly protein PilN
MAWSRASRQAIEPVRFWDSNETARFWLLASMIWNSKLLIASIFAFLFQAMPVRAQQTSTDDLKKQIQELSGTIKEMQKELGEIKRLLQARQPARAAAPQNVLLDLDDNPARGERTAKLTLIEFSDYQ